MEQFKAPSPLSLSANLADNWHSWEQSFRRYIVASGEKDEKVKIDILLRTIGEDALEVFNTLTVRGQEDEPTMEDVLQAFKEYCSPQRNVVFEQKQYWSHQRTAGTSVNTLITELQQNSKDCEVGISENDMLRDKLVLSITDSHLKKRLLQERGLTLYRARDQAKTPLQAMETEHEVQEVPVDGEMVIILPDKSLHHNTSRLLVSQSVPNKDETGKPVLAAFMPIVQLHRLQLQQPSVTDCVFSERNNVEQLLPERLHIKEEPEILSGGQKEKQRCVRQETNSAACPVKCEDEDEEEKPQGSQRHWRQLTEMNMKEEPSTCSLNELVKRQHMEINCKGPEAAQNPDISSLVLQGPDGTETGSSESSEDDEDDDDEDCWQERLSESVTDFDYTNKRTKLSDSSKKAEVGRKASKTRISSCRHICSKKKVQIKMTSEGVGGKKASLSAASKLRIHECDVCRKCFVCMAALETHMRIHSGKRPFKCDFCSKCFSQKVTLQRHMRIHTGEKPFQCDICSKCFIQKFELNTHMRIHTGEKPFQCDVCSRCFNRNANLKSHLKTHTGEKPFKCDTCSKCCYRKSELKRHMLIHTGEKPFECHVCNKCFTRKAALQLHMKIHTGEKPFKCDVCSKCFIQKIQLKLHMKIHTGGKNIQM